MTELVADRLRTAAELAELTEAAEHRLITAVELAALLNVSPHWVRRHTGPRDGIPYVRLGKYPRYRLAQVLVWLEENERGGAPTAARSGARAGRAK